MKYRITLKMHSDPHLSCMNKLPSHFILSMK